MKHIKLAFIDTPGNVDLSKHYFYKRIAAKFDIELCDDPDYVISLGYGYSYLEHRYDDCVKIFITAENDVPNFSLFDYALGHVKLSFGDRYLRHPIYAHWKGFSDILTRRSKVSDEMLLNRGFCSFVVSNNASSDPIREYFFKRLSSYKPVASGGRCLNNIGGPCKDKLAFVSGYKFNIAFENSSCPGYTTEKVMESFASNTVPIYWGDPNISDEFNPMAMVVVGGMSDVERAVDEIVFLDKNEDAYLKKCKSPCLLCNDVDHFDAEYDAFMAHIFTQDKADAKRLNRYGREPALRYAFQNFYCSYEHDILRLIRRIAGKIAHTVSK